MAPEESIVEPVLMIDGHLDLAFNALHHRRDLTQSVQTLREREDLYRDGVGLKSVHPDALRKQPRIGSEGIATVSLPVATTIGDGAFPDTTVVTRRG